MTTGGPEPWTALRLLGWTQEYLARNGVSDARLAAEVLLAHSLRCRRIDLYARYDYEPTGEQREAFRELVRRAAAHEPVAYLVGEKEFYSLRFKITPDVLIPRPETEILAAEAIAHLRGLHRPGAAWDVCTGSGCVAIATAHEVTDVQVLATDVSAAAVAIARGNAQTHGLADRVRCRVADLLALPDDCRDLEAFDVITGNPPYVADADPVAESVRCEPQIALRGGPDGLDFIRPIIREAPTFLRQGGALILEFGYNQADAVRDLLVAAGAFAEPRILRDHQEIERTAVARLRQ